MSENKNLEEKRKEFAKRLVDLFDEIKANDDREFSVLIITAAETNISTEHKMANALIASFGRRDLIGTCLCNLIDEDDFYKQLLIGKIFDEVIPILEAKFVDNKR